MFKIISVMADNAANNNIFFKEFKYIYIKNNIKFDHDQSHIWCLTYIMNLIVQEILKHIKVENIEDENVILKDKYNVNNIIPKVRIK